MTDPMSATEQPQPRDRDLMSQALVEARRAPGHGDVPVGAVAVADGQVIARGHNRREARQDPTAHAEMEALRGAARVLGTWRLAGVTLYSTLEPCAMCAGTLVLARVERLVYGAADPKAGAVDSLRDIVRDPRLNHQLNVTAGVQAQACAALLKEFFAALRN